MGVRFEGIDKVLAGLDEIDARIHAATPHALELGMQVVEAESVPQVPVMDGTLVNSRQLYLTEVGGNPAAALEYGTPYGHYQHEGVSKNGHPLHHEHGKDHFLSDPVRKMASDAVETTGAELWRSM